MIRNAIMEKVNRHYNMAVEKYGKDAVLGVFLYGSQNYNCDTENSDVDTKCILIPNLYHLAIKPYEVKHLHISDEVCECMTIMHMVSNWKKGNINFLEIMFTPFKIINPTYEDLWTDYMQLKEEIVRYDPVKAIKSIAGQALHTIKENPKDGKKIGNALRLSYALERYITGARYEEVICPLPHECAEIKKYKLGLREIHTDFVDELKATFEKYVNTNFNIPVSAELDGYFENMVLDFVNTRLTLE